MTIISRIVATAALFSLALVSAPGGASALTLDHDNLLERRVSHHAKADSVRRSSQPLDANKPRCKPRAPAPSPDPAKQPNGGPKNVGPNPVVVSTSSSTSSSAPKAPTPSPKPATNSGGGKVGLAWSNGENQCLGKYVTSKTKYLYTWDAGLPSNLNQFGLQGGRMLWGNAPEKVAAFRQLRDSGGSTILMGMNEVNEPSQANMDVSSGISLWNAEIRPYGLKGFTLVSPAVTSAPSGVSWLQSFFKDCGGYDGQANCGVDFLAVHYYDNTAQGLISYLEKFWQLFGIKIWLTEFACQDFVGNNQCNAGQVWSFMQTVTSWMDSTDYVDAYFAFGILHDMWNVNYLDQLMSADCSPTPLGSLYISS